MSPSDNGEWSVGPEAMDATQGSVQKFLLLRQPSEPRIVQWSLVGIQQLVYSEKVGEFGSVFQIKTCHRPRLEVNTEINVSMVTRGALVLLLILLPTVATLLFFKLHRSFLIKEDFCRLHSYGLLDEFTLAMFMPSCLFSSASPRSQNSVSYTNVQANYFIFTHERRFQISLHELQ